MSAKLNLLWEQEKVLIESTGQYERYCHLCERPMYRGDASIDHIVPKSLGGGNDISNLKLAHKICNGRKGNALMFEKLKYADIRMDGAVKNKWVVITHDKVYHNFWNRLDAMKFYEEYAREKVIEETYGWQVQIFLLLVLVYLTK